MPITQSYSFDNALNFNMSGVQINDDDEATLDLIPNPGQIFAEDFTDDTGFTYDDTKAEFVGGVLRQIDQRPLNSILGATFTSSLNLSWANPGDTLTGTLTNDPQLTAGFLIASGGSNNRGVTYSPASLSELTTQGTIKTIFRPNYSGSPASNTNIFENSTSATNANKIVVQHKATGQIAVTAYNNLGQAFFLDFDTGAWSPAAGQSYEISYDFSAATGFHGIFINGVKLANMPSTIFTRGAAARLILGAGGTVNYSDGDYNDVTIFKTIQHTANYTPGYSVIEQIFDGSKIDAPNFSYTGIGTVQSLDSGSIVQGGAPRFILGGQYWNGAAWAASNGTYAQANDFATLLANLEEFDTGGGNTLPYSILFTDTNTWGFVDEFEVEVTGEMYAATGWIEPIQSLEVLSLVEYQENSVIPANSALKIILKVDGELKYFNAEGELVDSDGSIDEANTATELDDNLMNFDAGNNANIFLRWVFQSDTGQATAALTSAFISYNFGGVEDAIGKCQVFGYLKDPAGNPIVDASIIFELNTSTRQMAEAANSIIAPRKIIAKTNDNGYFAKELIRSSESGTNYKVTIQVGNAIVNKTSAASSIVIVVPDADNKDITELIA